MTATRDERAVPGLLGDFEGFGGARARLSDSIGEIGYEASEIQDLPARIQIAEDHCRERLGRESLRFLEFAAHRSI